MLPAFVAFFATALAGASNPIITTQATAQYIWVDNTQDLPLLSYFTLPTAGNAKYFTHLKSQHGNERQYQIFINFDQEYSSSATSNLITCQTQNDNTFCQAVDSNFVSSITEMKPEKIIGELTVLSPQEKILHLYSGLRIEMMIKSSWKEYIQFSLVAASIILVMVGLFLGRIIKYLNQYFVLQLTLCLCVFVRESIEYVREGIENWASSGWKFWLFIPLSIITYQILESFMQAILSKRITVNGFLISIISNYFLYYISHNMLLYITASYLCLFFCQSNKSYQSSSNDEQKRAINHNSIQIMRTLYTVIHIKLLFIKEFSYFVTFNPIYFIIGSAILTTIWHTDNVRLKIKRETQQKEDSKDKIRVFKRMSDLVAEILPLSLSDILEQQCAICYQKIDQNWATTPCHHVFHAECLKEWLQKSETCPIDRKRALSDTPLREPAKKSAAGLIL